MYINLYLYISGVKNHLSWSPGQVKFQAGQAYIYFHPMSGGQIKKSVKINLKI